MFGWGTSPVAVLGPESFAAADAAACPFGAGARHRSPGSPATAGVEGKENSQRSKVRQGLHEPLARPTPRATTN